MWKNRCEGNRATRCTRPAGSNRPTATTTTASRPPLYLALSWSGAVAEALAADLFAEGAAGIRFWPYYRCEWTNIVLFEPLVEPAELTVVDVEGNHTYLGALVP